MMSDEVKVRRLAELILEETALTEGDRSMGWTYRAANHIYRSIKRHSNFDLFFDVLVCQDTSLCCPGHNEKLPGSAGRLNMFLLRLYRFPWLRHELQIKSTVACRYAIGKETPKTVCLNPFHYRSVYIPHIPVPPIVVNKMGDYGEPPERPENPLDDEPTHPQQRILTDEEVKRMTDEQRIREFRIPNVTMKGDEIKMLYERHSKFASMFPNGFVPPMPFQFPIPGPDGQFNGPMPVMPQMAPNFPNPAYPNGFYYPQQNSFDPVNYPGTSMPPAAPLIDPMGNPVVNQNPMGMMNPPPPLYGAPNFQFPFNYSPPPSYDQNMNGDQPMDQPMEQPMDQPMEQPMDQPMEQPMQEPVQAVEPAPSEPMNVEQSMPPPAQPPQEPEPAQSMASSTLSLASTTMSNFFPTPPQEGEEEHFYRSGLSSPASDVASPTVYRPAPNADAPAIPIHRAMDEVMEHDLEREQAPVDVEALDSEQKGERAKTPTEPVPLYRSSPSELSELVRRAVYECVEYEERSKWLALMYYEESLQIGQVRDFETQYCLVDGYSSTSTNSPSRFSVGYYNNPSRSETTSEVRSLIGKGVRLYLLAGEVYVENLSKVPVFVQSISANMKNGFPLNTVSKLLPASTMKVFDMRQFSKQLSAAAQKTYQDVYALSRMCQVRVSFVKGWGTNYRRSTVLHSPVWFQAHLYNPMAWIDSVLNCMGAPPRLCSSRT